MRLSDISHTWLDTWHNIQQLFNIQIKDKSFWFFFFGGGNSRHHCHSKSKPVICSNKLTKVYSESAVLVKSSFCTPQLSSANFSSTNSICCHLKGTLREFSQFYYYIVFFGMDSASFLYVVSVKKRENGSRKFHLKKKENKKEICSHDPTPGTDFS